MPQNIQILKLVHVCCVCCVLWLAPIGQSSHVVNFHLVTLLGSGSAKQKNPGHCSTDNKTSGKFICKFYPQARETSAIQTLFSREDCCLGHTKNCQKHLMDLYITKNDKADSTGGLWVNPDGVSDGSSETLTALGPKSKQAVFVWTKTCLRSLSTKCLQKITSQDVWDNLGTLNWILLCLNFIMSAPSRGLCRGNDLFLDPFRQVVWPRSEAAATKNKKQCHDVMDQSESRKAWELNGPSWPTGNWSARSLVHAHLLLSFQKRRVWMPMNQDIHEQGWNTIHNIVLIKSNKY